MYQLKLICKVSQVVLENHNRNITNFLEKEDKLEDKTRFQRPQQLSYDQHLKITALLSRGIYCQFKSYLQQYNITVHKI